MESLRQLYSLDVTHCKYSLITYKGLYTHIPIVHAHQQALNSPWDIPWHISDNSLSRTCPPSPVHVPCCLRGCCIPWSSEYNIHSACSTLVRDLFWAFRAASSQLTDTPESLPHTPDWALHAWTVSWPKFLISTSNCTSNADRTPTTRGIMSAIYFDIPICSWPNSH